MSIRLSEPELREWSLVDGLRAPNASGSNPWIERDYTNAVFEKLDLPRNPNVRQVVLPPQVLHKRAMTLQGGGSKGGYLAGVQVESSIAVFRESNPLLRLGAKTLPINRPVGSITWPTIESGLTAAWSTLEGAVGQAADIKLGQLSATPRFLTSPIIETSFQLLRQAPEAVEHLVFTELLGSLSEAIAAAAINGPGGAAPLGIMNAPVTKTAAASVDLDKIVAAEKRLVDAKPPSAVSAGWLAPAAIAELLAKRVRVSGGEVTLWSGALLGGSIEAAPAIATTLMPTATLLHGLFDAITIVEFSPIIIDYCEHYDFDKGTSAFRATAMIDVVVTHPQAFQVLTGVT